ILFPTDNKSSSSTSSASNMVIIHGISFPLTYNRPDSGSQAAPPHSPPPSKPGQMTVPSRLGGTNCPAERDLFNTVKRESFGGEWGLISASVILCRAKGGVFMGRGWVGQASSPIRSDSG